jgi:hypothetical protein
LKFTPFPAELEKVIVPDFGVALEDVVAVE